MQRTRPFAIVASILAVCALVPPSPAEEDRTIPQRLAATRVQLEYDAVPVTEIVMGLAEATGVPFCVERGVLQKFTEEELAVTVHLGDVSAATAIQILERAQDVRFALEEDFVRVGTYDSIARSGVFEFHEVGDLLARGRSEGALEFLADLVRDLVAPQTWDHPNGIWAEDHRLVVRNEPEVQAEVRRFLDEFRRGLSRECEIEVSIYRLDQARIEGLVSEGPFHDADLALRLDRKLASTEALVSRVTDLFLPGEARRIVARAQRPVVESLAGGPRDAPTSARLDLGTATETLRVACVACPRDAGSIRLSISTDVTVPAGPPATLESGAGSFDLVAFSRRVVSCSPLVPPGRSLFLAAGRGMGIVVRPLVREIAGIEPPDARSSESERVRERALDALDSRRIDVEFRGEPLASIVDTIAREAGVKIFVLPDLVEDELERGGIHLSARSISARRLLEIVAETFQLRVEFLPEVLVLGHRERRLYLLSPTIVRIHPVDGIPATLAAPPPPVPAGFLLERPPRGAVFWEDYGAEFAEPQIMRFYDPLLERIQESVAPGIWDEFGEYSMAAAFGRLVVRAPPEVQEEVARFIEEDRRGVGGGVELRLTRVRAARGFGTDLPFRDGSRLRLGGGGIVEASRRIAAGGEDVESFSVLAAESFPCRVARIEDEPYTGNLEIAEPGASESGVVVGRVRTGIVVDLLAAPAGEGAIRLSIDARSASRERPEGRFEIAGRTLEAPRIVERVASLSTILEPDEALLVPMAGPEGDPDRGSLEYLLVEWRRP